ncbi:MAG: lysophospholipase [Dehalogenimonas sp.]
MSKPQVIAILNPMSQFEGLFDNGCAPGLYYSAWLPETTPRAIIILMHGLADHSGRYDNVVNHLLPQGYAVWTFDQRGHGRSPGQRCYVNSFDDLTGDLAKFVDKVRTANPGLPLFLLGHSLGALEAADYATSTPAGIDGVVLSGLPLNIEHGVSHLLVKLAKFFSVLTPRLGVQKLPSDTISRDPKVVEDYVKDPLVYNGKIPARMGAELFRTTRAIKSRLSNITLPILVLHGEHDRMAEPSGSRLLFEKAASTDKELEIFPGCYHEIFNEPCRATVLEVVSTWLNRHTSRQLSAISYQKINTK